MDRRTALERLDAVRSGSNDLSDPEMAGLEAALAADDGLRAEFDRRRDWDRGITAALSDVPVPAGLKDQLLARLAAAEAASAPPIVSRSRRSALAALLAIAASLVAGVVYWTVTGSHDPLTVAQAGDAAAELLAGRAEDVRFDGGFDPKLPQLRDGAWNDRLRIVTPALGVLAENGEHRAAAWRVRSRSRAHWQAVVVAIPVDQLTAPPGARSVYDREYVPGGKISGVRTVSWTADGFVYVCCSDDLDALIDELSTSRYA